ncbi:caax protease self-immunity protein [Cystoisospora suis]|uniref:Caax protease self-immunity protein n=1 Tax=Cystoisospora suis TaxID=483139 RepID=A0A2C6LDJ5_9APIC|nr:caax protease self-immunity protein [Cystoisospora suis]
MNALSSRPCASGEVSSLINTPSCQETCFNSFCLFFPVSRFFFATHEKHDDPEMSVLSHPHTPGFGVVDQEGEKGAVIRCEEKSKDYSSFHNRAFLSFLIPPSSLSSDEWCLRSMNFRSCVCCSSKSCVTKNQSQCSSRLVRLLSCLAFLSSVVFLLLIFSFPLLVSGLRIFNQGSLRHCCNTPALESCLLSSTSHQSSPHLPQKEALGPSTSSILTAVGSFPRSFASLQKKIKSYVSENVASHGVPQQFLRSDAFVSFRHSFFPLSFSSFLRLHFLTSLVSLGSLSLNAWLSLNRIVLLPRLPLSCLALFRLHSRVHETLRRRLAFSNTSHVAIQAIIIAPLLEEIQFRWMIQKILLGGLLLTTTSFSKSPCYSTDTITDTRVSHSESSPLFLPLHQNNKVVNSNLTGSPCHNAINPGRASTPFSVDDKRRSRDPLEKLRFPAHTGDSCCARPVPATSDTRGKEPSSKESKESALSPFLSVSQVTRIVLTSLLFGLAHYQIPNSYDAKVTTDNISSPLTPSFSSSPSSLKSSLPSHLMSKASESSSPSHTLEKSFLLLPRHPPCEIPATPTPLSFSSPSKTSPHPSTHLGLSSPLLTTPQLLSLPLVHVDKASPSPATSSLPSLFPSLISLRSSHPCFLTWGNEATSPSLCRGSLDEENSRNLSTNTSSFSSTIRRHETRERNLPSTRLPSSPSVTECIGANRVISATAQALVWGMAMERGGLLTAISLHALHNAQQILILSIVKFLLRRMKINRQTP